MLNDLIGLLTKIENTLLHSGGMLSGERHERHTAQRKQIINSEMSCGTLSQVLLAFLCFKGGIFIQIIALVTDN